MAIKNTRKGAGLAIDFFVGEEGSRIVMANVIRWRYVCTAAADALKYHLGYPRAPSVPGTQKIVIDPRFCWRGECYGNDTLLYVDFALMVAPGMTESAAYLPGYTLAIRDTVRLCETILPPSCLERSSRDDCLAEGGRARE
ncbi:hypothetical protein MNEG_13979 [Monoraphidium neglectum]|uniref:Uncharacterized protein n=1 Tax=Monoraphidium neglectum TaxID=145388 RepID=A0A0D2KDS6_9CHLO|nr:hypothetical protein MNEG_13979 [Monoraphidium neglectum]KIY93983.1 hypothetical protein MNEG_13979 [Monoraphidium neglectum]|eukprot:XP_013893003.1 hypothetical protein MNEG_13979 [Monoraphidium neglectum]